MNANGHSYDEVSSAAGEYYLDVFGVAEYSANQSHNSEKQSVILLGPREPDFWENVNSEPEFLDNLPNPVDRWSERVVSNLAENLGGTPEFPFGGPPYSPFVDWALRSARAWVSPVGFLVHDTAGLFLSYRGAIRVPYSLEQPSESAKPCLACAEKPCLKSCPAGAISDGNYDISNCHGFLESEGGKDCMGSGCVVRRNCPVSKTYGRQPAQSAHHMKAFHK